jgi:hypothetical protein
VGSDDVWMFTAGLWADLCGPEISMLDLSGSSRPYPDGKRDFLMWALPDQLHDGDVIDIYFEEGSQSHPKGRRYTPDANAPEETEAGQRFQSWPPTEAELLEWERQPPLNGSLLWRFALNDGVPIVVGPDTNRQHVGLHILWNEERSERLRVNLSRSSIREICSRASGEELLLEYVSLGSHVHVAIGI